MDYECIAESGRPNHISYASIKVCKILKIEDQDLEDTIFN